MKGKWYTSSTGQGVSMTLKGLAVALVPIVIIVARNYGVEITEAELVETIESAGMAVSAVMVVFGLVRKLHSKFAK